MHSLYFVKFKNKENAKNVQYILDENGFSGESGFFSSSKADWYSVGGRWSGLMTQHKPEYTEAKELIKPLLEEELKKSPDLLDYLYINDHLIKDEEKKKQIDDIFIEKTGYPFFRNTYGDQYEDNVFEITAQTLAILKDKYSDVELCFLDGDDECIEDETIVSSLTEENIGEYLVIIDYHN